MLLTGIARLGRDCELRYMPDGTAVANLALAYNHGTKDAAGKRQTQWVDGALYGKRAEALKPHLLKGIAIGVTLADPHIEVFTRRDNTRGEKLVARIIDLEFAGGGSGAKTERPASPPSAPAAPAGTPAPGGFDDFDGDVPF
jgi:single-strand DNA-binding protein